MPIWCPSKSPDSPQTGSRGLFVSGSALTLWENLCYLKSYNRGVVEEDSIPGGPTPRATVTFFDGPRYTVIDEVYSNAVVIPVDNSTDGGDRHDSKEGGATEEFIELPTGRMHTGEVITQGQDRKTYSGGGVASQLEEPMPGVVYKLHIAADGVITPHERGDQVSPMQMPWTSGNGSLNFCGDNKANGTSLQQGGGGSAVTDKPQSTTSDSKTPDGVSVTDTDQTGESEINCDTGECCARGINPACCATSAATKDPSTGMVVDLTHGNAADRVTGVMTCGNSITGPGGSGPQVFGEWRWPLAEDASWDPDDFIENLIDEVVDAPANAIEAGKSVCEAAKSEWEGMKEKYGGIIARIHRGEATQEDYDALTGLGSVIGHNLLDFIGMIPLPGTSVADAANALWYAAEGSNLDALMSGLGAIPLFGDVLLAAWKGVKVALSAAKSIAEATEIIADFSGAALRAINHGLGASPLAATAKAQLAGC